MSKPVEMCTNGPCVHNRASGSLLCGACSKAWKARVADPQHTGGPGQFSLTPEQVVTARRMRSEFKTHQQIAEHFGVHQTTVGRALRRSDAERRASAS